MVKEETFSKFLKESTPKPEAREAISLKILSICNLFQTQMLCRKTYTDFINNKPPRNNRKKRPKKLHYSYKDK
jgi:hypothetical protein